MHRSGLPFSHINIQVSRIHFSKIPDQLLGLPLHDRGSKPIGCVITCLMSSKHEGLFNWALEAKKNNILGLVVFGSFIDVNQGEGVTLGGECEPICVWISYAVIFN